MPGRYEIMGYDDEEILGEYEDELEGEYDDDELEGEDDDDELEGEDDDDALLEGDFYGNELGARRRRRRRRRPRGRSRRRRRPVRRRVLKRRKYSRERGLLLGFDTQAIAIGATVDFSSNPQVPFRAKRVVIGATVIGTLVVEDIKIGKNSMLVTAGGFPAIGFAGNTFDQAVKFDTATPGIDIVITMTNNDPAINTTTIGMYGVAAER